MGVEFDKAGKKSVQEYLGVRVRVRVLRGGCVCGVCGAYQECLFLFL